MPFVDARSRRRRRRWPPAIASAISTAGGVLPRWRRDGRELFYLSPDLQADGGDASTREGHEASTCRSVAPLFSLNPKPVGWVFDVMPDGQRFVVATRLATKGGARWRWSPTGPTRSRDRGAAPDLRDGVADQRRAEACNARRSRAYLARAGLNRLALLELLTTVQRYEWPHVGDLLHVDLKRLGPRRRALANASTGIDDGALGVWAGSICTWRSMMLRGSPMQRC